MWSWAKLVDASDEGAGLVPDASGIPFNARLRERALVVRERRRLVPRSIVRIALPPWGPPAGGPAARLARGDRVPLAKLIVRRVSLWAGHSAARVGGRLPRDAGAPGRRRRGRFSARRRRPRSWQTLRQQLGLDQPRHRRSTGWLGDFVTGDLGNPSPACTKPVSQVIGQPRRSTPPSWCCSRR